MIQIVFNVFTIYLLQKHVIQNLTLTQDHCGGNYSRVLILVHQRSSSSFQIPRTMLLGNDYYFDNRWLIIWRWFGAAIRSNLSQADIFYSNVCTCSSEASQHNCKKGKGGMPPDNALTKEANMAKTHKPLKSTSHWWMFTPSPRQHQTEQNRRWRRLCSEFTHG